jgi:hypothetical protein
MLFYGERSRTAEPGEEVARLAAGAARAAAMPPGLERHERLVALLLEAGELAQGLGDLALAARGWDGPDPAAGAAMALCTALARALVASWRGGFAGALPDLATAVAGPLAALRARVSAGPLAVRTPEGYAHYALYPEGHAEAAGALAGPEPVRVIGIRSIGTSLAAVVAAAVGAAPPITVRPVGPPYARSLALAPGLRAALRPRPGERFAVVDEGPGLSGSSFAAVADALEGAGAAPERIHLFPGHGGAPGPAAGEALRARWPRWPRHHVPFEEVALRADRLPAWVAGAIGPADGPPEDLCAGAWRRWAVGPGSAWPPVFRQQERRKYLFDAGGDRFLAEFVGLGRLGEARLARARGLSAFGFGPPVEGLRHGFLVRRWLHGALLPEAEVPRPALVPRVAAYLGFRARHFPAGQGEGASPEALLAMLRQNAGEALGPDAARAADRFLLAVRAAATSARPVAVDGKLEPWEWLALPDGALVKADAVQHADAHDLVGCQDVAWDVAGARVELALDAGEAEELAGRLRRATGEPLWPAVLAFHEAAYLAHRVARWTFALATEGDPAEQARIGEALERYRALLRRALEGAGP